MAGSTQPQAVPTTDLMKILEAPVSYTVGDQEVTISVKDLLAKARTGHAAEEKQVFEKLEQAEANAAKYNNFVQSMERDPKWTLETLAKNANVDLGATASTPAGSDLSPEDLADDPAVAKLVAKMQEMEQRFMGSIQNVQQGTVATNERLAFMQANPAADIDKVIATATQHGLGMNQLGTAFGILQGQEAQEKLTQLGQLSQEELAALNTPNPNGAQQTAAAVQNVSKTLLPGSTTFPAAAGTAPAPATAEPEGPLANRGKTLMDSLAEASAANGWDLESFAGSSDAADPLDGWTTNPF